MSNIALDKNKIDTLFIALNKSLEKKMSKQPQGVKATLYVVGGANVVANLQLRQYTHNVDAIWNNEDKMRDCINEVADRFGLDHTWCTCNVKRTKSYTDAILTNSSIYKEFNRLIVKMANLDILLAMKLVAYREIDMIDCRNIMLHMSKSGNTINPQYMWGLVGKYFTPNQFNCGY